MLLLLFNEQIQSIGLTQQTQELDSQQQQQQSSNNDNDLGLKEIAAIKAQLLVLVGRLDRLEQELQK
jgi:hypothetical protein